MRITLTRLTEDFEFGSGVEMPVQRQKQITPPQQDHPAHRNSKRKYRESAPPIPSSHGQSKAPYVVTAQAMSPGVTEIHAPTPQRQHSGQFMQQAPVHYEQHEPNQYTQPAPIQHTQQMTSAGYPVLPQAMPSSVQPTQQMTTTGYPMRSQAVPAPAPAGAYAFDHASSSSTSAAVAAPPPAKKSRFSFQKFKRSSAVAAH